MSLTVRLFTGKDEAAWDAFVPQARNGTVFHMRKFLAYHPADRFQDHSLLFLDGEKLIAVLPAALKDNVLVSHPGASYGGFVLKPDVSVTETGAIVDTLIAYAKEKKFAGISLLRLPPVSLHRQWSEDQLYWAYQRGFSLTRTEMDGAIDLSSLTPDMVMDSLTGKCRNMVRQAERAKITVKLTNDFATYWPVLEGRHGTKPTHTVEEILKLHALLPNHFRLLSAHAGKTMVGGIVLITINDRALYTLYMAQEYSAQKDHPMHLLLAEAMKLAIKEGKKVLHLGVSTEDGGKKVNEGLFFFKESFGCRPVRRESWEIKF
jgi:hypothetical protein